MGGGGIRVSLVSNTLMDCTQKGRLEIVFWELKCPNIVIVGRLAEMEFEKNMQVEELQSSLEEQKLAKETELAEMKAKLQHTLDEQNLAKDTELDEVKAKLQRKEKEFEVLTQEMFERSKSKFREIDVLKKKLSEAERSLVRIYFCCSFFIYFF